MAPSADPGAILLQNENNLGEDHLRPAVLLLALFFSVAAHAANGTTTGTCRVVDGDTVFVATADNRTEVRRLSGTRDQRTWREASH